MTKIPSTPQYNLNHGCVCTPDGFLYVGFRTINFISSIGDDGVGGENKAPVLKCFYTRQSILSLDVDPHWGQKDDSSVTSAGTVATNENEERTAINQEGPPKLFAALLQDNSVQIWDFNKGCAIVGHKAHLAYMRYMEGNGPSPQHVGEVLISYMCNRNVLSVDNQDIVVYCVASNSFYRRPMFVSPRNHQMTSLKCSPYNENYFAVGTKKGLVLLCDLQKMTTLYTLRGHDSSIVSLSWNRINLSDVEKNIEDNTKPKAGKKKQSKPVKLTRSDVTLDADDIFDIYDYDYLDNEFGAPNEKKVKNEFSDFVGVEKPKESCTTAKFDFAEACQSLKEEIKALREEQPEVSPENIVSLEDCQLAAAKNQDDLSSCGSDNEVDDEVQQKEALSDKESSDDSMVRLVCRTPSSEESLDIDGMHRNKQQNIVCQADVHNSNLKDNEKNQPKEIVENEENIEIVELTQSTSKNDFEKTGKYNEIYDTLLASASSDGTFCVWNASTGATCDTHKIRCNGGKNSQIEIAWMSSDSLLINTKSCELQLWCLQPITNNNMTQHGFRTYKFKESKRLWLQRSIVSFACSPKHHAVWSISMNREITMENIKLNKIELKFSCISTNIGAIQECPDDMNKIALGFCDHRIGIIDISKMTPTSVRIENFVQRVESHVKSLKWSPDCKKIAYGTMEGRIGIINTEGSTKVPITFNSICGKSIYSINWLDKFLYVVCNERIAVYEDDPNKKDPVIILDIEKVACISLNGNYLFVGNQNGQLILYRRKDNTFHEYEFKSSLDLAPRYITEISWSPIATNRVAVVANANIIQILEFNHETADLKIIKKIEINSTKAANGCVKWSNRNKDYFLTCGFDGAVRVWDLSNENNTERFVKTYHCPMACGIFWPNDEEIIICSGKNVGLEFIDLRVEKTENNSGKSKRSNPRTLDTVQWATKALTHNDAKTADKKLNRRLTKPLENNSLMIENNMVSDFAKGESGCSNSEEVLTMLEQLHLQKSETQLNKTSVYMKNPVTLLYLTTKEINKDALDLMFSMLSSSNANETKSLSAKLYGTKAEAKQLLSEELKNHQGSEIRGISSLFMTQLNGNLKDEIVKCVQSKQLCEWHVSLAPSVSFSFWQKCCQAYAEQLVEGGYALQAAVYLLAIHKQTDAINMLIEKKYFKEALLIARIYLQPEDPLNNTISEEWIKHLHTNGNLTGSALLCLLTKQNDRAYEFLAKIRNTSPEIERVIRLLKSSS